MHRRTCAGSLRPRASRQAFPRPRHEHVAQDDEQAVEHERKRDGEDARGVDLRLERRRLLEREEDGVAEPLGQEEACDRRDRDGRDDRDAQAADDRGHGERQLDAREDLPAREPHPARSLEHVVRDALQARQDVREEDDQRVRDERDLDRGPAQSRERDEQLEERDARDRVEERGDDAERLLELAVAVREECERERDREADHDGERGQLEMLHQRRLQCVAPVVLHPVPAERVVARHAGASLPEVRDDGAGGDEAHRSCPVSENRKTPRTLPFSSTTRRSVFSSSINDTALRTVTSGATLVPGTGSPVPGTCSRATSRSRSNARPRSARSPPMNSDTKSSAGCARIASGVSYCASTPPWRRIAMRVPIWIASSMSCVTNITVFSTSRCNLRNSPCNRKRVIGSSAPNGSSIRSSGGSAASARASPTRWR